MKHRERIEAALNHQEPDRCPMQVSFTPEFADRLRADLAMGDKLLNLGRGGHNPHGGGNTYELERALGEDMLQTSVGWANSYYQDGDGIRRRVGHPLGLCALRDPLWHRRTTRR